MIHFPILRTRRLTVQLRELSFRQSIKLAAMPIDAEEAARTAFLRFAVESCKGVEDPVQWTAQERLLGVCHYLAAVRDDGPDFVLGGGGHYSDYLDGTVDTGPENVDVGEVGGDSWRVKRLTGTMAESIERLSGEVEGFAGRLHWLMGGMAVQMVRVGEITPDPDAGEGAFDEHLAARMRVMAEFPASELEALLGLYAKGRDALDHLFCVDFSDTGLVALPKKGGGDLPPVRFPVRAALTRTALEMVW